MRKLSTFILLFAIVSILFCCSNSKTKTFKGQLSLIDSLAVNISAFSKIFRPAFGFHLIEKDKEPFLVFIDKYHVIHLCPLVENAKIASYNFPDSIMLSQDYFSTQFDKNLFYVYLHKRKKIYSYSFGDSGLKAKETYNLSEILKKDEYFYFAFENTFEVHYPYICIGYGKMNRKSNYLDKNSYVLINLEKKLINQNAKKILHTQEASLNGKYYNTKTQVKFINDSILIYGFSSSDSLYKFNFIAQKYVLKTRFNDASDFRKHKKSKERDLGYLRWQESTNEVNVKFFHIDGIGNFTLKKLKKENLADKSIFEFFALRDKDFSTIADNIFPPNLLVSTCVPYKKGILVFADSLDKAYYYEL